MNTEKPPYKQPARPNTTPDFVRKLYSILEDADNQKLIHWSQNGDSVIIADPVQFSSSILPLHFKHNKFASFVRQLNKHNFHRVKMSSHKYGDHACEYQHDKFLRGRTDLLEQIFRQSSSNRNTGSDGAGATPDSIKIDSNLEALEEGQKLTFYQIKDLERRVDFFERELGSCRFTMESQSRIIIQLVNSMPRMPREFMEDPELSAIASKLNVQRDPAYHPYYD
eukprot:UN26011